ncbi:MAG: DUF721 domain-containing protein [Pseudomonadota bacterium]|jgi:hypothetical protein
MSMGERKRRVQRLDDLIDGAAKRALRRQGFVEAAVVTKWRAIVGDMLAAHCLPVRLRFPAQARNRATLVIRAESAFATELQHLAPLVIERINGFFGYGAVARLKIEHGSLPAGRAAAKSAARLQPLSGEEEAALARLLADITDAGLRARLASLGRAVLAAPAKTG